MKEIECETWEHFIQVARANQAGRKAGGRFWRGHADPKWKLASEFERWLETYRGGDASRDTRALFGGEGGPEAFEEGYLQRFKNSAIGIAGLSTDGFDESDWWILGRHHGLLTRLLDWTRSPYVAAFFAYTDLLTQSGWDPVNRTMDPPMGVVVLWALAPYEKIVEHGVFEIITSRKDAFYRQRAQMGAFTRLRHDVHLNLEAYFESRGVLDHLERITVPAGEVYKALHDLRLMNISYSTLFPDLDGAARHANLQMPGLGLGIQVTIST